jgi:hypothetical protein
MFQVGRSILAQLRREVITGFVTTRIAMADLMIWLF